MLLKARVPTDTGDQDTPASLSCAAGPTAADDEAMGDADHQMREQL
jgi:hypothetical protein